MTPGPDGHATADEFPSAFEQIHHQLNLDDEYPRFLY